MERLKQQIYAEPRSSHGTDHGTLTFVRRPINPLGSVAMHQYPVPIAQALQSSLFFAKFQRWMGKD
jgi:hypothetical protein